MNILKAPATIYLFRSDQLDIPSNILEIDLVDNISKI